MLISDMQSSFGFDVRKHTAQSLLCVITSCNGRIKNVTNFCDQYQRRSRPSGWGSLFQANHPHLLLQSTSQRKGYNESDGWSIWVRPPHSPFWHPGRSTLGVKVSPFFVVQNAKSVNLLKRLFYIGHWTCDGNMDRNVHLFKEINDFLRAWKRSKIGKQNFKDVL
jgi:hypothetical protein